MCFLFYVSVGGMYCFDMYSSKCLFVHDTILCCFNEVLKNKQKFGRSKSPLFQTVYDLLKCSLLILEHRLSILGYWNNCLNTRCVLVICYCILYFHLWTQNRGVIQIEIRWLITTAYVCIDFQMCKLQIRACQWWPCCAFFPRWMFESRHKIWWDIIKDWLREVCSTLYQRP